MRDAFIAQLAELAADDPRIMLVTGDLGFGVLDDYSKRYPKQFINAGVAEQNMTGLATGLALEGRIVFTYSIANFPTLRCLEQIRNDAAYHGANVNVVAIGGGFSYGALGMSHHATEDLAIMRALPEVTVLSPACLWEVKEATKLIAATPGTSYLRLDKSDAGDTSRPGEAFELGRLRRLREGTDISVIATGGIVGEVLAAIDALSASGFSFDVFSAHTLSPFDAAAALESIGRTGRLLIVEEHVREGGLGGAMAEALLDSRCPAPLTRRLGLTGGYSRVVGSQAYLRGVYGMDGDAIANAARELMAEAA